MRRPMVRLGAFARKEGLRAEPLSRYVGGPNPGPLPAMVLTAFAISGNGAADCESSVKVSRRERNDRSNPMGFMLWSASQSVLLAVVLGDDRTADVFFFQFLEVGCITLPGLSGTYSSTVGRQTRQRDRIR